MDRLCEPCMQEGKRVNSGFYCEACEEVYCTDCSKKHLTYKALSNHVIKPINETDSKPNQQMHEPMSSSPSQSIKEEEGLPNVSKFSDGYMDMGHKSRTNNEDTGSSYHPADSGQNHLLNHKNVTESLAKNSKDIAGISLHSTHSDFKPRKSTNQSSEENPYSYADERTDAKASATSQSSADQAIDRKPDKTAINIIGNKKSDAHVYEEIDIGKTSIEGNTYGVVLSKSPFAADELSGEFRLRLTSTGVELLSCSKEASMIYFWHYTNIHYYGGVPIFSSPTPDQNFPFSEGAAGRPVTTVVASDDAGSGTITYSITSQTPTNTPAFFEIDGATGVLTSATEIDYEAITGGDKATTVVVRARSSTAETDTASVTFTVTITDVNDNTPAFTAGVFCKAIPSNSAQGTSVGIYAATDADGTAAHNTITYAIAGGDDDPAKFAMDSATGEITTTAQTLTMKRYALNITASDGTYTGIATVNVPIDGSCDENGGGNGASMNTAATSVFLVYLIGLLWV